MDSFFFAIVRSFEFNENPISTMSSTNSNRLSAKNGERISEWRQTLTIECVCLVAVLFWNCFWKIDLENHNGSTFAHQNLIAKWILKLRCCVLEKTFSWSMLSKAEVNVSAVCPFAVKRKRARALARSLTLSVCLLGAFQREMRCQWDVICFGFWQANKW